MRITLSITNSEPEGDDQDLLSLEVYPDMTVDTLRSSIQAETGYDPSAQHLYHNGRLINENTKTLSELQIGDGEMLALHIRDMRGSTGIPTGADAGGARSGQQHSQQQTQQQGGGSAAGGGGRMEQDPEMIRLQILGDPTLRSELTRQQPELAAALDDQQRFAQIFARSFDRERRERAERHRQIQRLNADPFDVEAQARIEEMIRQERVMENLQNAMEHNPEGTGTSLPHICSMLITYLIQSSAPCTCFMSTLK
ncbi:DNA damage-inducible protein [Cercophora scortea]|uniref:DNA damage-inducible protein n=1 Tax=Cercophora scortea TaxID=314031 RepID=A0AAE0M9C5_9PEZI|nr:DNA damage-inducible protein [Cercophora scortea]